MAVNPQFLLVLKSNGLGDGQVDLSETLLEKFLNVLFEGGELPARIICMNSAIFLTTAGSHFNIILQKYIASGTEIYSCQTCLEYYGKKDKLVVGTIGNMKETVNSMLSYPKVISL